MTPIKCECEMKVSTECGREWSIPMFWPDKKLIEFVRSHGFKKASVEYLVRLPNGMWLRRACDVDAAGKRVCP